eukprot:Platyproteum_vivax@DN3277_c0_g1_i1.p1
MDDEEFDQSCCEKFCADFRSEFVFSRFKLGLPNNSQWATVFGKSTVFSSLVFLIYRCVAWACITAIFVFDLAAEVMRGRGAWLYTFLTRWTLLVTFLYFSVALAVSIAAYVRRKRVMKSVVHEAEETREESVEVTPPVDTCDVLAEDSARDHSGYADSEATLKSKTTNTVTILVPPPQGKLPLSCQFLLLLQSITMPFGLIVVVLFWAFFSKPKVHFRMVAIHGLQAVLILFDVFVNLHPFALLHCVYSVIFAYCYSVFLLVFYVAGGKNHNGKPYVYAVVDLQTRPMIGGFALVMAPLVVVPFFYYFVWFLVYCKSQLQTLCVGCKKKRKKVEEEDV